MVLVSSVRDYVNRMLQDISGMKVLILDSQTVGIISFLLFFFLIFISVNVRFVFKLMKIVDVFIPKRCYLVCALVGLVLSFTSARVNCGLTWQQLLTSLVLPHCMWKIRV